MKACLPALFALTLTCSPVSAATYVTDTAMFSGLGDALGTPFNQVTLNSVTGDFTGPGTYLVNTVDFTVGINRHDGNVSSGSFTDAASVLGGMLSYSVPYTLQIDSGDTLVIGGNTVYYGPYRVHFNTLTFNNIGVGTVSGNLTATIGTPEPATWSLMIIGFGAVGYAMRRNRKTAVPYA